jgi:hypothetical protein
MKRPIIRAEAFKRLKDVKKPNQNEIFYTDKAEMKQIKDNLDIQLLQEKAKSVNEANRKTTLANNRYEAETDAIIAKTDATKILTSTAKFELTVKAVKYTSAAIGTGLAVFGTSDIISSGGDIIDIFGDLGTVDIDTSKSNTTEVETPTLAEPDRSKFRSYLDKFLRMVTK